MGISSCYEGVPRKIVDAVSSDNELAAAIGCLWGQGSGMYAWFDELGEELVSELADSRQVPRAALDRLRDLLSQTEPVPGAYIEKTHDEHQSMLRTAFAEHGASNAIELARVAVFGERDWGFGTQLGEVTYEQCLELSDYMRLFEVQGIVNAFDLGERTPAGLWRYSLAYELQELVACYCRAGAGGYSVLTGVT